LWLVLGSKDEEVEEEEMVTGVTERIRCMAPGSAALAEVTGPDEVLFIESGQCGMECRS
jgi:hypothetical protein